MVKIEWQLHDSVVAKTELLSERSCVQGDVERVM